jgi:PhzF family phenazine biosynthesis protein
MSLRVFHVDAFTSKLFAGDPTAVFHLAKWLDDDLQQAVAGENNFSEAVFFCPSGRALSPLGRGPDTSPQLAG